MKTKDDNELFDENGILKDKSTLRTRMLAMDAKSINDANAVHIHRPGYRFSQKLMRDGDTDREAIIDSYTEYDNRVSNAWKNTPPELPNTPAAPVIDSDFDDEGGDCYSQYDARNQRCVAIKMTKFKSDYRPLETRIADALNGEIITSASLSDLIISVEDALPISTAALEAEKVRLVDPSNRDYEKTKQTVDKITLEIARLEAAIPMLEQRYHQAQHRERKQALLPEWNRVVDEYNEISVTLTNTYLDFCAKFVPMLEAAVKLNDTIRKMNAKASGLGLATIPLVPEHLLENLQLPGPDEGGLYWPDVRQTHAVAAQWSDAIAQVYSSPLRQAAASGDWWAAKHIEDEAKLAEWARINALQEEQRLKARDEFEKSKQR